MPALLTSTSMRPNAARSPATAPATAFSSVMSTIRATAPPDSATASSSPAAAMSHRLTRAPDANSVLAIARPIPPAPPVTIAVLPPRS